MGFNSVYRVLQDVFPQVDSRALKAVAIEHSKDADTAVEVVLLEIIPNLPEKPVKVGSSSNRKSSINFFEDGGKTDQLDSTMDHLAISSNQHEQSSESCIVSSIGGSLPGATEALDSGFSAQVNSQIVIEPVNFESLATSSYHDVNGETATECSSRFLKTFRDNITVNHDSGSFGGHDQGCVKIGRENVDNVTSLEAFEYNTTIIHDSASSDTNDQESVNVGCENVANETLCVSVSNNLVSNQGCVKFGCENDDNETSFLGTFGDRSTVNHDSGSSDRHDQGCLKFGYEKVDDETRFLETFGDNITIIHDSASSDTNDQGSVNVECENVANETLCVSVSNNIVSNQESDPTSSKSTMEEDAFAVKFVDSDDESGTSHVLARSEEKYSTELLEEIIEDAKNSKKTLALAMSSVVDLMREVESKEKAVDQANEDAIQGCADILAKAEEVKQALLRAKEANDMHAGEVNAEKAILATELKELQLRLFTLSDERNRSLGILDEMRKSLEIRLTAALDEIAAAEGKKFENERAAKEALAYQESQMEKVVEESKKLKLEAEENSKLQEFLMDRGRAIDILQGEISVKCQDVLLLKEKFDKGILLTRSLSSSQTSSILASSGSSFRSVAKPVEPEPETFENLMKSMEMDDSYGFVDKVTRSDVAFHPSESMETDDSYGFVDKVTRSDVAFQSSTIDPVGDHKMLLEDGWDFFDK